MFDCIIILMTKNNFNDDILNKWYLMSKIIIKKWIYKTKSIENIQLDRLIDIKNIYNSNKISNASEISNDLFNIINKPPNFINMTSKYDYLKSKINNISPEIINICEIVNKKLIDEDYDRINYYLILLISSLCITDCYLSGECN